MSVLQQLSFSLGKKDQAPNRELAQEIVASQKLESLPELVGLFDGPQDQDKRILMDAMLTIAYVAELNPQLVVGKVNFLIVQLNHELNRVRWGSMIALSHLVHLTPSGIFQKLPVILDAMSKAGVVGRDHGFRILVSLYVYDDYAEDLFLVILEQLSGSPPNQLSQYTERLMNVLRVQHKPKLINVLEVLRDELENEYHRKRLDKNLKKLYR